MEGTEALLHAVFYHHWVPPTCSCSFWDAGCCGWAAPTSEKSIFRTKQQFLFFFLLLSSTQSSNSLRSNFHSRLILPLNSYVLLLPHSSDQRVHLLSSSSFDSSSLWATSFFTSSEADDKWHAKHLGVNGHLVETKVFAVEYTLWKKDEFKLLPDEVSHTHSRISRVKFPSRVESTMKWWLECKRHLVTSKMSDWKGQILQSSWTHRHIHASITVRLKVNSPTYIKYGSGFFCIFLTIFLKNDIDIFIQIILFNFNL